jgi:hypothetical protein
MVHEGDSKVEIKVPKYRDFSSVPCPKGEQQQEEVAPRRTRIGRQPKNFVVQLHSILDELENDGLDTIACWQPHGRAFIVKNADELVSRILSKCVESKFERLVVDVVKLCKDVVLTDRLCIHFFPFSKAV